MRILSQALSGFLSGFYLCLMIIHMAMKTPLTSYLEAWQQYNGDIPATAAGNAEAGGVFQVMREGVPMAGVADIFGAIPPDRKDHRL